MKKDVEITLKKDGSNDIIIKCPEKIKLHPVAAWFALSYGLPPAKINPVQGKDVLKAYALFACIFLSLVLCCIAVPLGIIACLIVLCINLNFTRNYFFDFIRGKIADGYQVENEDQRKLLEAAGIFDEAGNVQGKTAEKTHFLSRVSNLIDKLPFNGFAAKIPAIQKFSKYANYAVCIVFALFVFAIFSSKNPVDSYIDDLEGAANSMAVAVEKCEDGHISYEEMQSEVKKIVADIDKISEKYSGKFQDSDIDSEQAKRLQTIMKDVERLNERSDRLQLQYYYN